MLGPFLPLAGRLGRLAMTLAEGSGVDRLEIEYFGRIAERDTRLLTLAVLRGVLAGHCEEEVNLVNAPTLAEERGIGVSERTETVARDFTDLLRVTVAGGGERFRVVGTTLGRQERPHLLEAWGNRFNLQLDEGAHLALFRYVDLPGMMGRVGTVLGTRGVNISSAAVGRQEPAEDGRRNEVAVMVVTTDSPVPRDDRRRDRGLAGLPGRPRGLALAARLLRLRLRRRVAALHHLPQARALELGLEVPVRRLGGDPLLPHRLERRRGLGVELGDQVRAELLLRLAGRAAPCACGRGDCSTIRFMMR